MFVVCMVGEMVGYDKEMCAPAVNGKSKSQPKQANQCTIKIPFHITNQHGTAQSTANSMFAEQQKNVKINKQISKQIFNL